MITSTHMFCGGGGDTAGLLEAGFTPVLAINHDQASIETHSANFPDTDHLRCDVSNMDMRRLPHSDVLWASPICQESSPAGGSRRHQRAAPGQLELLEYGSVDESTWERTRATAYDILRAVEARQAAGSGYAAVLCENVIEFTAWPLFGWWIEAMALLGYDAAVTCVSSAHIGGDGNPRAPQWRDRVYVVFTRRGVRSPDLEPRPVAACPTCGDIEAVRWWKDERKSRVGRWPVGKYRQQYLYRCPTRGCHAVVEPRVTPAADALDLTDVGQRVGDRSRPLATATRARIAAGLAAFATPPGEPFIAMLRRNGVATSINAPLATIAAGGTHHALIVPYYRTGRAKTVMAPLDTLTVRDRFALIHGDGLSVDDCHMRMLRPREAFLAQRFPADYQLRGNRGAQTAQAGNAVSVNVAHWLGAKVAEALGASAERT